MNGEFDADGFSAAITSVVVDHSRRGRGLGRQLLAKAEEVVAAMGFGYMYLWTHDAQPFLHSAGGTLVGSITFIMLATTSAGAPRKSSVNCLAIAG